jgi:hypothetical protein
MVYSSIVIAIAISIVMVITSNHDSMVKISDLVGVGGEGIGTGDMLMGALVVCIGVLRLRGSLMGVIVVVDAKVIDHDLYFVVGIDFKN